MRHLIYLPLLVFLFYACTPPKAEPVAEIPVEGPIQLHPDNPHYFLYQGDALALITSAEHYGAVLNNDFDYQTYLNTLADDGMNYTRIFTGVYFEINGESFGIQNNTLAPKLGRVITPWKQLENQSGELKYDLTEWNEAYFQRLHSFMELASSLDIVVEVTLFSSIYRDEHWDISPQNPQNNVNIDHDISRLDAQTLNNGDLIQYQEALVRKIVQELNGYDNLFFEIQNEPWADRPVGVYNIMNKEEIKPKDWTFKVTFADQPVFDWHDRLIDVISEEESHLPKQHLIAQNYCNFRAPIPYVNDKISIINFHYAWPDAAYWNYHYDKVLGFDESGFAGSEDQVYRRQAWQFMLSGGGLFNNLDYSFYVGHEDGRGQNSAPGGGSATLRRQLSYLSDFLHSFELQDLQPDQTSVGGSPGLIPHVLSDGAGTYAIFLRAVGTASTSLELVSGSGSFEVQTLNPITGDYQHQGTLEAVNGSLNINVEIPDGELGIKVIKL